MSELSWMTRRYDSPADARWDHERDEGGPGGRGTIPPMTCHWAGCGQRFPYGLHGAEDRRQHERAHGAEFGHGPGAIQNTPLGPRPWRLDLEGSDAPCSIIIVAADGRVAFRLEVLRDLEGRVDDEIDAIWEAGLQLAERIVDAGRHAPPPRLRTGDHMSRYFEACRGRREGAVVTRSVACPQCGEVAGVSCA